MRYECDLIRDVAPLYKDGALSENGAAAVKEHLSGCKDCRAYYDSVSNEPAPVLEDSAETKRAVSLGKRITVYRAWQLGTFFTAAAALFTMIFPWFGYPGITEVKGISVLGNPFALTGVVLFTIAVWYNFKTSRHRRICGLTGIGLWLFFELYYFLTIPMGYSAGISWGPVNIDIPCFERFSIIESLQNALPALYAGIASTAAAGVVFCLFVKNTALDMT